MVCLYMCLYLRWPRLKIGRRVRFAVGKEQLVVGGYGWLHDVVGPDLGLLRLLLDYLASLLLIFLIIVLPLLAILIILVLLVLPLLFIVVIFLDLFLLLVDVHPHLFELDSGYHILLLF